MHININKDLCCGDALCVKVCPTRHFKMANNKATLNPTPCIACGHCIAICPKEALSFQDDQGEHFGSALDKSLLPSIQSLESTIKFRRSTRFFKNSPLSSQDIEQVFDIARYAPTAKNQQYIKWILLNNKEKVEELTSIVIDIVKDMPELAFLAKAHSRGDDILFRHAPSLLFAYCEKEHTYGTVDCSIATAYADLAFNSLDIGTCWAGYAMTIAKHSNKIHEYLGLTDDMIIQTALMLGYKALHYKYIPPRLAPQIKIID